MRTITATALRSNLSETLDDVLDNMEEVVVTRAGRSPVVIMPQTEYAAMMETVYLLTGQGNRENLLESMRQNDEGEGITLDVSDL